MSRRITITSVGWLEGDFVLRNCKYWHFVLLKMGVNLKTKSYTNAINVHFIQYRLDQRFLKWEAAELLHLCLYQLIFELH